MGTKAKASSIAFNIQPRLLVSSEYCLDNLLSSRFRRFVRKHYQKGNLQRRALHATMESHRRGFRGDYVGKTMMMVSIRDVRVRKAFLPFVVYRLIIGQFQNIDSRIVINDLIVSSITHECRI